MQIHIPDVYNHSKMWRLTHKRDHQVVPVIIGYIRQWGDIPDEFVEAGPPHCAQVAVMPAQPVVRPPPANVDEWSRLGSVSSLPGSYHMGASDLVGYSPTTPLRVALALLAWDPHGSLDLGTSLQVSHFSGGQHTAAVGTILVPHPTTRATIIPWYQAGIQHVFPLQYVDEAAIVTWPLMLLTNAV